MQDPTQFYRDEAQLHYQRQFTEGRYVASQNDAQYVSYWDSLRRLAAPPVPQRHEYRSFGADRAASSADVAGRSVAMGGQLIESVGELVAMEVAGELAMKSLGITGGVVGGIAAMYAYDKATTHFGVKDAIGQFRAIEDVRFASGQFMAGSYADPVTGRMDRDQAKKVNDFLVDYSRLANAFDPTASSLDETKAKVARLTDLGLLDNVRDAEDFAEKFSKLNEGLLKMSEALGKSYEAAASTLSKLKRMNVSSTTGVALSEDVRALGTMGGLDFDTAMNAALQGAAMTMGTGIGPRAGALMGAQGASMASLVYEQYGDRPENERFFHRMGGEEGLRQFSTQATMRIAQSSWANLVFAQSYDAEKGVIDQKKLREFVMGDRSLLTSSLELDADGVLSFEANLNGELDQIMQDDPLLLKQLALTQGLVMAENSGMDFKDESSLFEFMGGVLNMSKDEVRTLFMESAAAKGARGQAIAEELAVGRGRLEGRGDWEFLGLGRAWRGSALNAGLTQHGLSWSRFFRDTFYEGYQDIREGMHYRATGRVDSALNRSNQEIVRAALEEAQIEAPRRSGGALYGRSGNDATDTLHAMSRLGLIEEGYEIRISDREYQDQTISRDARFYRDMGAARGLSGRGLSNFIEEHAGKEYTFDEFGRATGTYFTEGHMEDDIAVRALKRGVNRMTESSMGFTTAPIEFRAYGEGDVEARRQKDNEAAEFMSKAADLGLSYSDLEYEHLDLADDVFARMHSELGSGAKLTKKGRMLIGEPIAGGSAYREALEQSMEDAGVPDELRARIASVVLSQHRKDGGLAEPARNSVLATYNLIAKDGKTLLDDYEAIENEMKGMSARSFLESQGLGEGGEIKGDAAFVENLIKIKDASPDIDDDLAREVAAEMSLGRSLAVVMRLNPDLQKRMREDEGARGLRRGGVLGGWKRLKAATSEASDEIRYIQWHAADEGIASVAEYAAAAELLDASKSRGLTTREQEMLAGVREKIVGLGLDPTTFLDVFNENDEVKRAALMQAAEQADSDAGELGAAQDEVGGVSLVNERILEQMQRLMEANQHFNAMMIAKMDALVSNSR